MPHLTAPARRPRPSLSLLLALLLALSLAALPGTAFGAVAGAPFVNDQDATVAPAGGPVTLFGFDDEGDAMTFQVVTGPTHGVLGTMGSATCDAGSCDANVSYTPDAGTTTDS